MKTPHYLPDKAHLDAKDYTRLHRYIAGKSSTLPLLDHTLWQRAPALTCIYAVTIITMKGKGCRDRWIARLVGGWMDGWMEQRCALTKPRNSLCVSVGM